MNHIKRFLVVALLCSGVHGASAQEPPTCYVPDPAFGELPSVGPNAEARFADFDADGDMDLVVVEQAGIQTWYLTVLRNQQGVFSRFRTVTLPGEPTSLSWVDVNSDGALDLCCIVDQLVKVFINSPVRFYPAPSYVIADVASLAVWGDVDGDGDADLVISPGNHGEQVAWYRNDGDSLSRAQVLYTGNPWSLDLADFDFDGDLDIAICGNLNLGNRETFALYLNNAGVYVRSERPAPPGNYPFGGINCDLDSDGDLDFVGSDVGGMSPGILRLRAFEYSDEGYVELDLPADADGVLGLTYRAIDLDGDGRRDVIVSRGGGATFLLTRAAGFELQRSSGWLPRDFADVDGDGRIEAVAISNAGELPELAVWSSAGCSFVANEVPQPPSEVHQGRTPDRLTLSWEPGTDSTTPADGLTYLVEVRSEDLDPALYRAEVSSTQWVGNLDYFASIDWSIRTVDASGAMSAPVLKRDCQDEVTWDPDHFVWASAWADYDNDGDFDLAEDDEPTLRILENQFGTLVDAGPPQEQAIYDLALAWSDPDGDGDLDLAMAFEDVDIKREIAGGRLYINNGGSFSDAGAQFPELRSPELGWGDFDNDGDEDLVVAGNWFPAPETGYTQLQLLRNQSGVLGAPELLFGYPGAPAWTEFRELRELDVVDVDGDGDQDILVFFQTATNFPGPFARLFRNDSGVFTPVDDLFPERYLKTADTAWADVDNDGVLELFLAATGDSGAGLWEFEGTGFVRVSGPDGVNTASIADQDNDGQVDILTWVATELGEAVPAALKVFDVQDTSVVDRIVGVPRMRTASTARLIDFDGDGRIDLYAAGDGYSATRRHSAIMLNGCSEPNVVPSAPTDLHLDRDGDLATFTWAPGSDDETPVAGLNYNLRVGSAAGASDIMPALSDPATGRRLVPEVGNVGPRLSWTLTIPASQPVYWAVQSIDGGFLGSPFAAVDEFGVPTVVQSFEITSRPDGCVVIRWIASRSLRAEVSRSGTWVGLEATLGSDSVWSAGDCPSQVVSYRLIDDAGVVHAQQRFEPVPGARLRFGIQTVRPNPFNPSTQVEYAVEQAQRVRVEIYDARGRLVRVLADGQVTAGEHSVPWEGIDASGRAVAGGIYYVRLVSDSAVDVRKIALVK